MNARVTPALILITALLVATGFVLGAIWIAVHQPWLGMNLEAAANGAVVVTSTDETGTNGALPPGSRLLSLAPEPDGGSIALIAADLIEEPDAMDTFAELEAFFAKQGRIHAILSGGTVFADIVTPEGRYPDAEIGVSPRRAFVDLPLVFWVQVFVGGTGFLVGAWVWSLRRRELPAFFFALAGLGLMISALPAAIYSTRELALPEGLFTALSNANHAGALIFGAGTIGLFLTYPRRLVSGVVSFVPSLVLGLWVLADILRLFDGPPLAQQLPITLAMAAIAILVGVQYRATRGDPRGRVTLRWLGLSVLIGAGAFVLTVIVPEMFGYGATLSQGYAFLFFLIIYAGVALGVLRYRLFDLEEWAFRILFAMAGILLIVALDIALVFMISIEQIPAFSLSFVLVALIYLPFRDLLWRRFFSGKVQDRERLFAEVVDIALTPPDKSQAARWQALLQELFDPLAIQFVATRLETGLDEEGLVLSVPQVEQVPALRLEYAHQGRKLFGPHDAALIDELVSMLSHTMESRRAFERGAAEERRRIARDMHDNIGAQLLSALHSRAPERKDMMIRESLTDLRDIINNSAQPGLPLDETLANLRAETVERLNGAGIRPDWTIVSDADITLSPHDAHALRSVIREAVSNIIRHSGAAQASVSITCRNGQAQLSIADDGKGYDPASHAPGNGLINMKARLEGLKGTIEIVPSVTGTHIRAAFPLSPLKALS